jgi:hypothetical protein
MNAFRKGLDMRRIIAIILTAFMLVSCGTTGSILTDDSGTFRGKWYNYYQRGIDATAVDNWDNAEKELKSAISKRPKDQRMARTYGMHFIDYFPHREIGITLLQKGNIEEAIRELETSISQEESAKASFYLNKARKIFLQQQGGIITPPEIVINTPVPHESLNSFHARVRGRAAGDGYVAKITINGFPYRFDLAEKEIDFEMNIDLSGGTNKIEVTAEDLLGNPAVKAVEINIDREGPAISIFDIVEETGSNRSFVRLIGSVNDSTGIRKLIINSKTVAVKESGVHQFDIVLDRASLPSPFIIEAYDTLNNMTRAEVDIEKELRAFRVQEKPVLLTMVGTDLFSSDSSPPVISLKDATEMPPVFVDTYYVEGEVSDNRRVENVYVNSRTVLSEKGKKIYFSKLVKIDEGKNDINVEAFDSSGNRSEAGFAVTRKIPEVLQVSRRMSVSILPFEMQDKETTVELLAYDQLTGSFVNQKRFNVIERDKLEQVLLEQKLTREKLTDPEHSIKIGRLLAADTILATSASVGRQSVEFTSRVINTETSEIMDVKDVFSENISAVSIQELMDGLASKIAGSFPLVEGKVIKSDNKFVYTDLGTKTGIKGNMGIILYRPGKEIRHPLTGKYLGRDMENLGAADIEEIHGDYSRAKLSDRKLADTIKVNDMVITR